MRGPLPSLLLVGIFPHFPDIDFPKKLFFYKLSSQITGLIVNSYRPIVLDIPKTDECMSAFLEIFRIAGRLF
jgi:hypothetical protein